MSASTSKNKLPAVWPEEAAILLVPFLRRPPTAIIIIRVAKSLPSLHCLRSSSPPKISPLPRQRSPILQLRQSVRPGLSPVNTLFLVLLYRCPLHSTDSNGVCARDCKTQQKMPAHTNMTTLGEQSQGFMDKPTMTIRVVHCYGAGNLGDKEIISPNSEPTISLTVFQSFIPAADVSPLEGANLRNVSIFSLPSCCPPELWRFFEAQFCSYVGAW